MTRALAMLLLLIIALLLSSCATVAPLRFVVDQIDGESAQLEAADGRVIVVTVAQLPAGTREGHVLTARLTWDERATRARYDDARRLRDRLPRH